MLKVDFGGNSAQQNHYYRWPGGRCSGTGSTPDIKRGGAGCGDPTGSGKSQLIADVEQYTEEETLTGRKIMINDRPVGNNREINWPRFLVAQVSQNMNFVIDTTIEEFLHMHARVRAIKEPTLLIKDVLSITNQLSGEPVSLSTNLTQLSGGQSRALMVADVALISSSPVVLIDEIENAGIDRLQALEILKGKGKIVVVVSHDPTLILMAGKRVVMKNGGMVKICFTSDEEKNILGELVQMDRRLSWLKNELRTGNSLGSKVFTKEEFPLWPRF